MKFDPTPIDGVWLIGVEPTEDERGFFARSYCRHEFAAHGIHDHFQQTNLSYNRESGTLRGMHYQSLDAPESKLVRCIKGKIYDVVIDIRPTSKTFRKWHGVELNDQNRHSLYIPPGLAHGFITLTPESELLYMMSGTFTPTAAHGIRWNDPLFHIKWPIAPAVISDRDHHFPDFVLP